ncbi:MAG: hypothetical protein ACR2G7_01145 [Acidimicrobiales bacterium]
MGGAFIDAVSWRAIFLLNLPLATVVAFVAWRHLPETCDVIVAGTPLDLRGAALAAIAWLASPIP